MTTRLAIPVALLGLAMLAGPAQAQVYSWVDKEGTLHFGEEPPADTGQPVRKIELPPDQPAAIEPPEARTGGQSGEGAAPGPPSRPPASAERPAARPRITSVELFTTSWCPWCKKARAYFDAKGIAVIEHDIESDASALARKLSLDGHQRVPTVVIGGRVVRGYAPAQYQAALERR